MELAKDGFTVRDLSDSVNFQVNVAPVFSTIVGLFQVRTRIDFLFLKSLAEVLPTLPIDKGAADCSIYLKRCCGLKRGA